LCFDLDPAEGLRRARGRAVAAGGGAAEDRFEQETLAFHERVRDAYLDLARRHPERFRVIDARGDADAVAERVLACLPELP